MSVFEVAVICLAWAATCVLCWIGGYMTAKVRDGES